MPKLGVPELIIFAVVVTLVLMFVRARETRN